MLEARQISLHQDLAEQKVNLASRLVGIDYIRQMFPFLEVRDLLFRALSFYEHSASAELDGREVIAVPKKVIDLDKPELEEMQRLRFDTLAKNVGFKERYMNVNSLDRAASEFYLGDAASQSLLLVAQLRGVLTSQELIERSLDRYAIALEFTSGAGIFTTRAHYLADYSESEGSFSLLEDLQ